MFVAPDETRLQQDRTDGAKMQSIWNSKGRSQKEEVRKQK
jgi:hypothetical protein